MYTLQEQKKCSVNITSNKNRIKQYESSVYLKDGQQFELERIDKTLNGLKRIEETTKRIEATTENRNLNAH